MRSLNHSALPLARATQNTKSFDLTESYGASALQAAICGASPLGVDR
jgi:hypothetical protein